MGCAGRTCCLVDFLRFAHLLDIRKRIVCNCLARFVDNCQMESIQNNCIYRLFDLLDISLLTGPSSCTEKY